MRSARFGSSGTHNAEGAANAPSRTDLVGGSDGKHKNKTNATSILRF